MSTSIISLEELSKIPFIDTANLNGRFLATATFHFENEWRFWISVDEKIMEVKAWPAESAFFATAPESAKDISFTFLDFFVQHASFTELKKLIFGMQDDVYNIAASLSKVTKLHELREHIGDGLRRMIATEVEYLILLCRSLFDLLQEIVSNLWRLINVYDSSFQKKNLKETFSGMVFENNQLSTSEQIVARFNTPKALADYYVRHADFFVVLRQIRDNIIHGGTSIPPIFSDDDGLYVKSNLKPFDKLGIWEKEEIDSNDLAPLKPLLDVMVRRTFLACEDLCDVLPKFIDFPPPIVPGMSYYLRGYFNEPFLKDLIKADERIQKRGLAVNPEVGS